LVNAPRPPISAEVSARIQSKVLQAHRKQFVRATPRLRVYSYTRYLAVASVIMVLFFAGFIPAMASSVPGDFWYPAKTGLESVELALATSDEAQASVYLTHAERRTEEAHILLTRGTFDDTLITRAINALLDSATVAGGDGLDNLAVLQTRTSVVNAALEAVLLRAETRQLASPATIALLHNRLDNARENGDLLLPETPVTVEVTPEVVETDTPAANITPTNTPSATSASTPVPTTIPTAMPALVEVTAEITAEVTESVEATPDITAVIQAAGAVNVRRGPGLQYAVIATLPPSARVPLLGWSEDGAWLNILLDDGRSGWIASTLTNLRDLAPANSAQPSGGGQGGNGTGGDFGCEHPGNYCNAPGQTGNNPGQGEGSGQGQGQGSNGTDGGKP
jgi:hypothetical protein